MNRQLRNRLLINGFVLAGILFIALTGSHRLTMSWQALHQGIRPLFLVPALGLVIVSFIIAAQAYRVLSSKAITFGPVLLVQIASGFVNRLLPAGLGGLGLFTAFFRKRGLSLAAASALVVTNNILGVVGNIVLATLVLLYRPTYISQLRAPHITSAAVWILGLLVSILLAIALSMRRRWLPLIQRSSRALVVAFRTSLRPDRRTALGLICNMVLTLTNAEILNLSVQAAGGSFGLAPAVLVLSLGTLVGSVVPTPGGVGGVEAGLLAGLVADGVSSPIALPAVLIYRLLSYWLPILPGVPTFQYVKKHYL